MPNAKNEDMGIVLWFLRRGQGWSQTELGKSANIPPNLLNAYEQGRKTLSRERLLRLISFMALPPETIDETLGRLEANRTAGRGAAAAGGLSLTRRRVEEVAVHVGRMAAELTRSALSLLAFEAEAMEAREGARRFWARLEARPADERLALIEDSLEPPTWALCELVCAKSIEMAPSSPAQALELAGLALRIAERCRGDEWLRKRTQGYAWFHVANARRVANGLPGSVAALATATKLWEAGAPGDPGLFNEAIVLALEANIRKSQRRFPEARKRIEEALAADRGELRGKLLLTKSQILRAQGDIEGSTEVLRETIPYVDEQRDPRTALGVRSQFLLNLCLQDRAIEAAPHLREVEAIAGRLGQEVDLVRVGFLQGIIAAGLGSAEEAEEAFEQARRRFSGSRPPLVFDYSLVSLELGLLLLKQGRTSEVKTLAEQMAWVFSTQGVQVEALAAIRMFCDAAKREAATLEMARSVIRFLHQSQHDPGLKFGETEEAGIP
jgi:tetratricopeptide (TPR) repeat protein/transcriptional regulator with XRE-family HTH domain